MPSNFLFKFIFECSHRAIPNISDRFSIRFSVGGTKKQKMCGFILDEYGELSNGYLCDVCACVCLVALSDSQYMSMISAEALAKRHKHQRMWNRERTNYPKC